MFKRLWQAIKKIFTSDNSGDNEPEPQAPLPDFPKIALIRGHKASAKGAKFWNDLFEYDYWGLILPRVVERTERTREFLRDGTTIEGAIQKAVDWGAAIIIETHCNAYNGHVKGAEVWIFSESQRDLAGDLLAAWLIHSNKSNRGVKTGGRATTSTRAIYRSGAQGCLFEPFFGDSKDDYVEPDEMIEFLVEWIKEQQGENQ